MISCLSKSCVDMLLQQSLSVLNVAGNGLDSLADLLPLQELTHLNASDNLLADMKVRAGRGSIASTVAKQSYLLQSYTGLIC